MPYALTDHLHEREVSAQLGIPVEFMPHVASHFRGITLTANLWLQRPLTREHIKTLYATRYANDPLIDIIDPPPGLTRLPPAIPYRSAPSPWHRATNAL